MSNMAVKAIVMDIDPFSTHEGPGIRRAIFLKGCPISCKWCHSPESQSTAYELLYQSNRCALCLECISTCVNSAISNGKEELNIDREKCKKCFNCVSLCPSQALSKCGKEYTVEEILSSIKQDLPFYRNSGGGITVTGGEPLMQADFTYHLIKGARELGVSAILQTSGYGKWEDLEQIARQCRNIFYDIKILDEEEHKKWTGFSNKIILENLEKLCKQEREKIIIRLPCIPDINDSHKHIRDICLYVKSLGINSLELLPYNIMAKEKYSYIGRDFDLIDTMPKDTNYYKELNTILKEELCL